jgi:PAS domain S-box-containing protein
MSEKAYESAILDSIATGLIVIGSDRAIVGWNAWMESASGKSAAGVVGKRLSQVFAGADLEGLDAAIDSAIDSGAATLLTSALHPALLPLRTRVGRELVHDVMVSTVGDGSRRQCVVQIADVTNSARRERFLRDRLNARYDALVESAPDVIMNVDSDGIIRLANPAAARHFGYRVDELVGSTTARLFESESAWLEICRSASSGAIPARPVEVVLRLKNGASRYFEASAAQWRDGARTFTTAILRDINDRRDAEAALRESERQSRANARALAEVNESLKESSKALNAADRRKDQFLATLAHELRNPLAPLRNGLQLLKLAENDSGLIERTRHMMDMQLGQMVRLIDDLLDVSRINNDMMELNRELTSLHQVIRQAVETSGPLIDAQQHKLTIDIPKEEILLEADVIRLTQVFANLLNNAAKYTPRQGHIAIKVSRQGDWATVSVVDSGIGIPEELLAKIFDMFMQVDYSLGRAQGGLGIGLSLVKRLVEMHGGTVEARSQGSGAGSEFIVRLRTASQAAQAADSGTAEKEPARPVSRRILVADDNKDSATSLALILSMMGHETKTANDGVEALEVGDEFRPEVALVDIGMPKLNGYDTARQMRQKPWGRNALLVALTGWGQEDDLRRSSDAGFDTHLVKPVDVAEIVELVARIGAPEGSGTPPKP